MSPQRSGNAPVTLLPFLAVLICTMGALIVLLVVVVQQARVEGVASTPRDLADPRPDEGPPIPVATPAEAVEAEDRDDFNEPFEHADESIQVAAAPESVTPESVAPPATDSPADLTPPVPSGPTWEEVEQAQRERDKYLWEIQLLAEAQQNTQQRLSEKNLELSHLEEHTRRLVAELKELQEKADQATVEFAAEIEQPPSTELAGLEQQINAKKAELDSLRAVVANRRNTYRLVPYNGSQGTTRRPIYVECRDDAVVIQPEGIHLTAEDFALPSNAGNPLAAALRAVREYWAMIDADGNRGEPYPLLVVRPGGEKAYMLCRQAMKSWDNEFGYELVSSDVPLAYPDADTALAETIQQSLVTARQQQRHMLALIAATRPNAGPTYRASRSGGGFVREGGRGNPRSSSGSRNAGPPAASPRGPNGPGRPNPTSSDPIVLANGRPGGLDGSDATSPKSRGSAFQPAASSSNSGSFDSNAEPSNSDPLASGFVMPDEFRRGEASAAGSRQTADDDGSSDFATRDNISTGDNLATDDNLAAGDNLATGNDVGTGDNLATGDNNVAGDNFASGENRANGANFATNAAIGENAFTGQSFANEEDVFAMENSADRANSASNVPQAAADGTSSTYAFKTETADSTFVGETPQETIAGPPPSQQTTGTSNFQPPSMAAAEAGQAGPMMAQSAMAQSSANAVTSIANTRGRDWALPNAVQSAIPIERPLFVAMNRAQLVLEAEPGTSQVPVVVTFEPGTRAAVQTLVTRIWQRIESWGVAGPGVYWRPKLKMNVSPDAEAVYAELEVLLRDSGLLLERD